MKYFSIDDQILQEIDLYHQKSLAMQHYLFDGNLEELSLKELESVVNDPLIFNVPIYDMLDRRYAAFCSLLEAIDKKEHDPKQNGKYFMHVEDLKSIEFKNALAFLYLFRLCGSGINYKPNNRGDDPLGTHGFGNFWIVDEVLNGNYELHTWLEHLKLRNRPFTDNKGYLLPQFSYRDLTSDHLKFFIITETEHMVNHMISVLEPGNINIMTFVDEMNAYLNLLGYKKQGFVLSATAADIAEYFPNLINPKSEIYAGTNAKKCIAAIFKKERGVKQLIYETEAINFLADRYDSVPYSVEDSRLCDVYRYLYDFQSKHHIEMNGGKTFENNSGIKQYCEISGENYNDYITKLLG